MTEAIDDGAWSEVEEAIDLAAAGMEFGDAGPIGGPWHEGGRTYIGGTYQRWEPAQ